MTSRRLRSAFLAAALLAAGVVHAAERPPRTLLERIGISRVEQALRSSDAHERERALTRLGAFGTARSLELLVRALDPNGAAQSSRERLIAVRMLASHVNVTPVRECLVRVMTGISAGAERAEPLQALLRDTAALALAASQDSSALEALGKALRQPGRVAQAAAAALAAHPPEDLSALARAHYAPTADLVRAFEELGDERAFELLRDVVRRAAPELQAAAAVALTRLGNFETVALAERWARGDNAVLRLGALEILLLARAPGAAKLAGALLKDEELRPEVIALLAHVSDAKLEEPLRAALSLSSGNEKKAMIAALGQSARAAGLADLRALVADAAYGDSAAYALAQAHTDAAGDVLTSLLDDAASQQRALRGLVLRAQRAGALPARLRRVLERFAKDARPSPRSLGVYGLSLFDKASCVAFLKSRDDVTVQAAARAAPFVGAARDAAARLRNEPAGPTRTQLALALLDADARAQVPVRTLLDLLDEGGAAAPLALFALGARDSEEIRPRLLEFTNAPDPLLRSALELGLGESPLKTARSLLAASYLFEPDAEVRHAQIIALGRRPEASRLSTLSLAARLDPDARVREAARLGQAQVQSRSYAVGKGTLWLALENADPNASAVAVVSSPAGLALPVLSDPDGIVMLAGLAEGKVSLRLALEPRERKARGEER